VVPVAPPNGPRTARPAHLPEVPALTDSTTTPTTTTSTTPKRRSPLAETQRARRGHAFYPPADLGVPELYGTEDQPTGDKTIYVHYFAGGCDWWIAEYDPATGEAFGYACLGRPADAEWGYVDLRELERVCLAHGLVVVERDLCWTPLPARAAGLPGHRAT